LTLFRTPLQDYPESDDWLPEKSLLHEWLSSRFTKHEAKVTIIGGQLSPDLQLCAQTKASFLVGIFPDNESTSRHNTSIQFHRLCILLLWIVNPCLSFGACPVGPSAVI
jgi:hypothetical protein